MRLSLGVTLVAWCWFLPVAASAQPTPSIAEWRRPDGTGFSFDHVSTDARNQPDLDLPDETTDHAYKIAVNTDTLTWGPSCHCYRYYVIYARSNATGLLSEYKFKGKPVGSFDDPRVPLELSIPDALGVHKVAIGLPMASAPGLEPKPLVEVTTDKKLHPVELGTPTDIQVTVYNPSHFEGVEIPSDVSLSSTNPELWKQEPTLVGNPLPMTLAPLGTKTLKIHLEPLVSRTLAISFAPTDADLPHTAVGLDLPFRSRTFSGRDGRVRLGISLRFGPSPPVLGLWLLTGVVLGSLVPLFSGGKASWKKWARSVGAAALAGILLEVFGVFLAKTNSKLLLGGYDIDPRQTAPVMFLGILAGLMGVRALRFVKDLLLKTTGTAAPHP